MSRHYVLDFDGTLIDTDVYWDWIVQQFLELGHEEQIIRLAGENLFPVGYTVEQHALDLGMDTKQAREIAQLDRQHVEENHASLIFSDVNLFLSRYEGAQKSVLTFGDKNHQTRRVVASGLSTHIPDIRIATAQHSKASQLVALVEHSSVPITFVDDDLHQLEKVHQKGLPIDLVRMRRPGQRKSIDDHELDDEAWRVIRSLDEIE